MQTFDIVKSVSEFNPPNLLKFIIKLKQFKNRLKMTTNMILMTLKNSMLDSQLTPDDLKQIQ